MPRARHNHSRGRRTPPHDHQDAQVEVSAGGIVFKRTQRGVRIAFILDPFGKWAFAKGHVEEGETIIDAAIRETREEMGIHDLQVIAPLGTIDFWFCERYRKENRGATIHKYVHYYLMEAPAYVKGRPQRKERIKKIIWVGLRRLVRTSSYDDVRPILDGVLKYFNTDPLAKDEIGAVPLQPPAQHPRPSQPQPRPPQHHQPRPPQSRIVDTGDLGTPLQL